MEKYLNKQFNGMIKREKEGLAYKNLGKLKEDKMTLDQIVQQGFAYTDDGQ